MRLLNNERNAAYIITILFLSIFIISCSSSGSAPTPAVPVEYGGIEGTVVESLTGKPVANATVVVYDQARITGSDGSFSFERIPVGVQKVNVTKSGYAPLMQKLTVAKDNILTLAANLSTANVLRYDVVILGAGTGGVSAAVQAARLGVKVALIEESDWIGGQMTAAAVTSLDEGPYIPSHRSGIYSEFFNRILAHYLAKGKSTGTAYFLPSSTSFEPSVGRNVLNGLINDAVASTKSGGNGVIDVYLRTQFTAAVLSGNLVQGVILKDGTRLDAGIVIDATEYGDFLPLTTARYRVGNSTSDNVNLDANLNPITYNTVIRKYLGTIDNSLIMNTPPPGYAQVVNSLRLWVTNDGTAGDNWYTNYTIDYSKPMSFAFQNAWRGMPDLNNPVNYDASSVHYMKITKTGINAFQNDYPVTARYLEDLSFRKQINCSAMLKTLQVLYYFQTELNHPDWSVATDEGFASSYDADANICPSLSPEINMILKHLPVIPYVRESRRVIGMTTLVAADIRRNGYKAYKRYPTVVAVGDYPIDLHGAYSQADLDCGDSASDIVTTFNTAGGAFQIPFEVFVPEKVDGLLVAEKNLSVSRLVEGAIREQPVTMMTGQAAGAIAAMAVKQGVQPRNLSPSVVQQALINNGCILSIDN